MDTRFFIAIVVAGLAGAYALSMNPVAEPVLDPAPPAVVAPVDAPAPVRPLPASRPRGKKRAAGDKPAKQPSGKKKALVEKRIEQRSANREKVREEGLRNVEEKLPVLAKELGWSSDKTQEVRSVLKNTYTEVAGVWDRVEAGELARRDAPREVLEVRQRNAEAIQDLIGSQQEFAEFSKGMGFDAFEQADRPARRKRRQASKRQ